MVRAKNSIKSRKIGSVTKSWFRQKIHLNDSVMKSLFKLKIPFKWSFLPAKAPFQMES